MPASREKEEQTREKILRVTSRLVATHGYQGTSTRSIAAEVGIRQPSLFHHFESKQAILAELLDRDLTPAVAMARAFADTPGSAGARLYAYYVNDLRSFTEWPYDIRGLYTGELLQDPAFAKYRKQLQGLLADVQRMVDQGIEAGEFREMDSSKVPLVGAGIFLAAMWAPEALFDDFLDTWPEVASEFILRGVLKRPSTFPAVKREGERILGEVAGERA